MSWYSGEFATISRLLLDVGATWLHFAVFVCAWLRRLLPFFGQLPFLDVPVPPGVLGPDVRFAGVPPIVFEWLPVVLVGLAVAATTTTTRCLLEQHLCSFVLPFSVENV